MLPLLLALASAADPAGGEDPSRFGAAPCLGAFSLVFLPGGTQVLSLDEKLVLQVCDLRSGEVTWRRALQLPTERGYTDPANVRGLAVSDDGAWVALTWQAAMVDDFARLAAFRIGGDGRPAWPEAVAMPDGDARWIPVWSPDGREVWVATTSGRAPLQRVDAATGAIVGTVPDVALGVVHDADRWIPDGPSLEHPLELGPIRTAEGLWTAGAPQGLCDRVRRCTERPVPGGRVNPTTGARTTSPAEIAVHAGTDGFRLAWTAAPDADHGTPGTLTLTPAKGRPVTVDPCPAPPRAVAVLGGDGTVPVLVSPDGGRVTVSGCDGVTAIDTATGARTTIRPTRDGAVRVLAPPGGPLGLAWYPGAGRTDVVVFDAATGAEVRTLEERIAPERVADAAFSPDGRTLASAGGPQLRFHHRNTGSLVETTAPGDAATALLGWLDDDRVVVSGGRGGLQLSVVDAATGSWTPIAPRRAGGEAVALESVVLARPEGGAPRLVATSGRRDQVRLVGLDATGLVVWDRPVEASHRSGLRVDATGGCARLTHAPDEGRSVDVAVADGSPCPRDAVYPSGLDDTPAPRATWGAWTGLSPDGGTLAEVSWLGTVWFHPYDGPSTPALDAAIARVRAGAAVRADQLVGHWSVEHALFDTADGRSPIELAGLVGAGGYRFGADGSYGAGLFQIGNGWRLLDDHTLETVDARGDAMRWSVRVDGDVMEWALDEPRGSGSAGVKSHVRLRRDP